MRPPLPESGLTVIARPGCSATGSADMNWKLASKWG